MQPPPIPGPLWTSGAPRPIVRKEPTTPASASLRCERRGGWAPRSLAPGGSSFPGAAEAARGSAVLEAPGGVLEPTALVARQTVHPLGGDLVEQAIELAPR